MIHKKRISAFDFGMKYILFLTNVNKIFWREIQKCKYEKSSELPECVTFKENWFNLTFQLAQEDPGI